MKRRRSLQRVTAKSDYPPGMYGSPNVLLFPKVETYYRITRSTAILVSEGRQTVIHSWLCEEESTFGSVTTGHKSWRAAMDHADSRIQRAQQKAATA